MLQRTASVRAAVNPRALFWGNSRAGKVLVQSCNCSAQALRDYLRVVLESCLRVSMPEVSLDILNRRVVLHVCCRSTTECLMGDTTDSRFFSQRLQVPFQIIAYAEGCSRRAWKEKRARVLPIRKCRNPCFDFELEVRWHRNKIITLVCLGIANPLFAILTFFQRFIDSEVLTSKIFNPQNQNLGGPQTAYTENTQDDVLAGRSMKQQGAELLHAKEPSARFLRILGMTSLRAGLLFMRSSSTAYSKHPLMYARIWPTVDLLNPSSASLFRSNCSDVNVTSRIL